MRSSVIGVVQREVAYDIVKSMVDRDAKGRPWSLSPAPSNRDMIAYQVYKGLVSFLRDLLMVKVWDDKPPFVYMDDEEYGKVKDLLKAGRVLRYPEHGPSPAAGGRPGARHVSQDIPGDPFHQSLQPLPDERRGSHDRESPLRKCAERSDTVRRDVREGRDPREERTESRCIRARPKSSATLSRAGTLHRARPSRHRHRTLERRRRILRRT